MRIEQIYTKCLAEASYYIESNGEAVIIDPIRDVDGYLDLAKEDNAKIKYIFETHFHADFVSGHVDLAQKTDAKIVYGPTATTNFDCIVAKDNQEFQIGELTIKVLHTPGHTLESVTYLLVDSEGKELAIFTGDTLFLGDVGRPDLAIKSDLTQEDLAGMLYDSLRNRIMTLPDDVIVYPGHGAGSSCGKSMSKETIGVLGEQKQSNYALRANMTKEEFIKEVTDGILPPPQYFPKNAILNKTGYASLDDVIEKGTTALSVTDFKKEVEKGALILDVRNQADFMSGFIPNSLFIGLNGAFAMWVGAVIEDINQKIVLITPEGKEEEAVTRLARVGYDNTVGFLKGGIASYDEPLKTIETIPSTELATIIENVNILDVRKPGEWQASHYGEATHYPLDYINEHLGELNKETEFHVHCAGGYRSVIAISILMQNGYDKLINITDGFGGMKKTNIPLTDFVCPSTLK